MTDTEEPAAQLQVTFTFTLHGEDLATVEAMADLAAAMDTLMAERYPQYRGPQIKITTDKPFPMRLPGEGDPIGKHQREG